jgi:plasmid replication initiation protein
VLQRDDLKHNIVTKANELARAGHNLTLMEAKALEYCISSIFKDQVVTANDVFEVDVNHLGIVFGIDRSQAYREIRTLLSGLLSKIVRLEVGEELIDFQWLSAVRYNSSENGLYIQFNPIICKLLSPARLNQGNFTTYPLEHIIHFKHKFTLPLYNLIKSNNYRGMEFKTSISLADLRDFLGLTEKEYPLYANFKVQLEKNIKEMDDKAGLKVTLHERKTGKKVSMLVFVVET